MAFDLLAVPPEVRVTIYQQIADSQHLQYSLHLDAHAERVWRLEGPDDAVPNLWTIASGCKTTYREALTLLYGSLEIYVFLPDDAYQIDFYTGAFSRFPSAVSIKDLRCLAIDLPVDHEAVNNLEAFMQLFEFGKHLSDFSVDFHQTKEDSGELWEVVLPEKDEFVALWDKLEYPSRVDFIRAGWNMALPTEVQWKQLLNRTNLERVLARKIRDREDFGRRRLWAPGTREDPRYRRDLTWLKDPNDPGAKTPPQIIYFYNLPEHGLL